MELQGAKIGSEFYLGRIKSHIKNQSLLKEGDLDDFLRKHNWQTATPVPPRGTKVRFELPWEIEHRSGVEELVATA